MLRRVEEALERVIEGGLGRLSGVSIHPLEIARGLQARMQDAKLVSTSAPYVPNRYAVRLHNEDLAALSGVIEDVAEQIARYLGDHAAEQGWARGNHIEVAIGGGGQAKGRIEIEHNFHEAAPDARLLVEVGEASGGMFEIGERVTIGRDPDCEVALVDPSVSRRHASIEWTYAGYVLRDLGSRNGTFLGGEPVAEATLVDGDLVQVGSAALRLAMRE